MTRAKGMLTRLVRVGAVAAASIAMILGLPGPQAYAASSISAGLDIDTRVAGSPSNIWHNAYVDVHLPMSQADASGYIYWGARIEITCWGDDTFLDDDLFNPNTFVYDGTTGPDYALAPDNVVLHNVNRLWATDDGVRLRAIFSAKHNHDLPNYEGGGFDEDFGTDEIFCRATWVDADGHKLTNFTRVVSGDF